MRIERSPSPGRSLRRAVTIATLAALLTLLLALPSGGASSELDALGTPVPNFAGIAGGNPPDPTGDVGPNHFVQAVNSSFSVWNKTGTQLLAATALNTLFAGANSTAAGNGICATRNDGDPIVVYDQLADRWLISQFAASGFDASNNPIAPFSICIAISRTANPAAAVAGNWFGYDFNVPAFPDYPKFGVWPDAYYMSSFEGANLGAFAFDRTNMLLGNAATFVRFTIGSLNSLRRTRLLPADWDGTQAPPAAAPNPFVRSVDGQTDDNPVSTNDRLEVFNFAVNFATPALSTFGVGSVQATQTGGTPNQALATNAFDPDMCYANGFPATGPSVRDCIPQPGTTQLIDALSNRLMMQLKYRSFNGAGTDQRMVVNQTVDTDGTDRAGIRWYELRNAGAGWAIFQQGDYSPSADDRWMGSMAMDKDGNIAVGYSISNGTAPGPGAIFPSLRYAGRVPTDTLGTLPQGEFTLLNGTASQTNSNRWGDYSQMSVDPVDDCTFWFVGEFAPFSTQIGAFRFPSCTADLEITKTDSPDPVVAGTPLTYTVTVREQRPACRDERRRHRHAAGPGDVREQHRQLHRGPDRHADVQPRQHRRGLLDVVHDHRDRGRGDARRLDDHEHRLGPRRPGGSRPGGQLGQRVHARARPSGHGARLQDRQPGSGVRGRDAHVHDHRAQQRSLDGGECSRRRRAPLGSHVPERHRFLCARSAGHPHVLAGNDGSRSFGDVHDYGLHRP